MPEKELYSVIVDPNGDGWLVGEFNARIFEVKGHFDNEDRAQEFADELNRRCCSVYSATAKGKFVFLDGPCGQNTLAIRNDGSDNQSARMGRRTQ